MAQKIKQGNIFGRIGTGIGQGLAEQVPKEIDRYRLASGLRSFEQEAANLTPMQQLARLSSIPGVTPQMIQSFSELARMQNLGQAYGRAAGGQPVSAPPSAGIEQPLRPGVEPSIGERPMGKQPVSAPPMGSQMQRSAMVAADAYGQPQIADLNPLDTRATTVAPWTPQQRNAAISSYIQQGFLPDQARQLAADDEARSMAQPEAYQKEVSRLEDVQSKAREELNRQLQTKLQKKGEGVYADISGEMLNNLERGMSRDLRLGKGSVQDVANEWTNKALNLAKAKSVLNEATQQVGFNTLLKGSQTYNKLKSLQKTFAETNNSEEFYNTLRQGKVPAQYDDQGRMVKPARKGLGLSPYAAADIAYPRSARVSSYISKIKPRLEYQGRADRARRYALEIADMIEPGDSIQAIASDLYRVDPSFDQSAFFEELTENQDQLRLNERQKREIGQGPRDITPTWRDLLVMPFRRSVR